MAILLRIAQCLNLDIISLHWTKPVVSSAMKRDGLKMRENARKRSFPHSVGKGARRVGRVDTDRRHRRLGMEVELSKPLYSTLP